MKPLLLIPTLILATTLAGQPEWEPWDKKDKDKDKKPHPHHPIVPEPAQTGMVVIGAGLSFYLLRRKRG